MTPHALYTVTATRNGTTIKQFYVNPDLAMQVARELRRAGYDAQADTHGYSIQSDLMSALNGAHLATRTMSEPLDFHEAQTR